MRSDLSWWIHGFHNTYYTPGSDHSGSEPPGAHQRALLWVWGHVRPSRLRLQSPRWKRDLGPPQQSSRCYQTHTCVHADTPNTDSSAFFLSKTAASAQSRSRGPLSVAAVAPGLDDQIRSHGMTGPSSSLIRRVKRGEATGIASRGSSLSCDVHESYTELVPSQEPTSQPRFLTSHLS